MAGGKEAIEFTGQKKGQAPTFDWPSEEWQRRIKGASSAPAAASPNLVRQRLTQGNHTKRIDLRLNPPSMQRHPAPAPVPGFAKGLMYCSWYMVSAWVTSSGSPLLLTPSHRQPRRTVSVSRPTLIERCISFGTNIPSNSCRSTSKHTEEPVSLQRAVGGADFSYGAE